MHCPFPGPHPAVGPFKPGAMDPLTGRNGPLPRFPAAHAGPFIGAPQAPAELPVHRESGGPACPRAGPRVASRPHARKPLPAVDTWIGRPFHHHAALPSPRTPAAHPRPGHLQGCGDAARRNGLPKLRRGYQCSGIGRARWPSCWPANWHRRTHRGLLPSSYPTIFLSPLRRKIFVIFCLAPKTDSYSFPFGG